jgi:hypothetical protein
MGSKAFPPPKLLLPAFTPPCLASSTLNTGISVRVCVEGEKVCSHDTSVQNYCLLEQRRPHDTILYSHDPAVALPFKYTESIVSAASALHCTETALCYWTRTFIQLTASAVRQEAWDSILGYCIPPDDGCMTCCGSNIGRGKEDLLRWRTRSCFVKILHVYVNNYFSFLIPTEHLLNVLI